MKKAVKIILIAIAAASAAGAMTMTALKPMDVTAVTIEPKEAYSYFIEEGTVVEGIDFSVFPEVSGAILSTDVKKSAYVNTGDVILTIDTADYERQVISVLASIEALKAQIATAADSERDIKDEYSMSISELNSQLTQIEAQRKKAEADRAVAPTIEEQKQLLELLIEKAQLDVDTLTEHYNKQSVLYENGVLPKAELDSAKSSLDTALIALRQYQTEYSQKSERNDSLTETSDEEYYHSLKNSVNQQIAALTKNMGKSFSQGSTAYYNALIKAENETLRDLESKIEKCTLKSPVSGFVAEFPAESTSFISPALCAVIIKTDGNAKIESYVSQKDIGVISVDDEVELVFKGRDGDTSLTGTITDIGHWAEEKISALGLYEKKIRVTIEADSDLVSGYDMDVKYTVYKEQAKLLVPTGAIFSDGGKDYVFTVANDRALKTAVVKGVKTLTETVIESGLSIYDTVISEANTEGLRDGKRVKPVY